MTLQALKGNRDYLHGTTIFDIIQEGLPSPGKEIVFTIKKMSNQLCQVIETSAERSEERLVATYTDQHGERFVYETDEKLTERIPYDEDRIAQAGKIDNQTISFAALPQENTFIETIVAGYKYLLNTAVQKESYVFAQLEIDYIPTDKISIQYKRLIMKQFYQGDILHNEKQIGKIYFGVKK